MKGPAGNAVKRSFKPPRNARRHRRRHRHTAAGVDDEPDGAIVGGRCSGRSGTVIRRRVSQAVCEGVLLRGRRQSPPRPSRRQRMGLSVRGAESSQKRQNTTFFDGEPFPLDCVPLGGLPVRGCGAIWPRP